MGLFNFSYLFSFIFTSINMCFRCFDGDSGGSAPATTPDEMTMDDIKGIISTAVKDCTKEQIDELKAEIIEKNRKGLLPHGEFGGEMGDVTQDSVIDTSTFFKSYGSNRKSGVTGNAKNDGMFLGKELSSNGGPFKRLSKAMETFAGFVRCQGNFNKAMSLGLDMKEHNEVMKVHYKQAGLNEGTLSEGGVFVPPEWAATVIEFAVAQSPLLSQVWRIPMNSNILRIPRLAQASGSYFGGMQFFTPGEGGVKESTMPEFEQLTYEAKKLVGIVYLTDELIQDSNINIVNYVTGLYVRAFQYEMERRIIAAAGGATGPCLGVVNDPAINIVNRTTAGTVTIEDVIAMDNALDESFQNLTWLTRKVTQNTLMALRDSNNRPVFLADYGVFAGQPLHPPTLIQYPVHRTRNVPAMGTSGDLILGDFSWYILAMRQELKIDQSEHVRFLTDEQTLRFVMRFDGAPAVSMAFAKLHDVAS